MSLYIRLTAIPDILGCLVQSCNRALALPALAAAVAAGNKDPGT
jgi:hypothetical protein